MDEETDAAAVQRYIGSLEEPRRSQLQQIDTFIRRVVPDLEPYIAEKYRAELPKADIGKSCIRFRKFEHIDFEVLEKLLKESESTMAHLKVPAEG